jgi:hypothetical protein
MRLFLFHQIKLNSRCNSVRSAASKLALVIYRRTLKPQVGAGRKTSKYLGRGSVQIVSTVRKVRNPPISLNLNRHFSSIPQKLVLFLYPS